GVVVDKRCVIGQGVNLGFNVKVGDDCQIMDRAQISGETVIGNRCFISVHVVIVNDNKPRGYKWKGVEPVVIGNDVVIGAGALIRPGVKIGDGATIAMGALVVKDVEPGTLVKGPTAAPVMIGWGNDTPA